MMEDIRDIKGVIGVLDWGAVFFLLLILIVFAVVGYYLARFISARLKAKAGEQQRPRSEIKPFPQVAEEALLALDPLGYYEKGQFKEYYFLVTEIVRVFLAKNYLIETLEKTSREMIEAIERVERDYNKVKLLESYFQACDLVKFAKYRPSLAEMKEAKTSALQVVKECWRKNALG